MVWLRNVDESIKIKIISGIDIVIVIDVLVSMLVWDLKFNRFEVLKEVVVCFINECLNDRIGLVEYVGESYIKIFLISDKSIVLFLLKSIIYNIIIEGGIVIGMGLVILVNRLKDSCVKSKVIILLIDGVNNIGFIDLCIVSELVVEFGIKIYIIGLGINGMVVFFIGILFNG